MAYNYKIEPGAKSADRGGGTVCVKLIETLSDTRNFQRTARVVFNMGDSLEES